MTFPDLQRPDTEEGWHSSPSLAHEGLTLPEESSHVRVVYRLRLVSQGLLGHVKDSCGRELYNLLVLTLKCLSCLREASHGTGSTDSLA